MKYQYPRDIEDISIELHTLSSTLSFLSLISTINTAQFCGCEGPIPTGDAIRNILYNASIAIERISTELGDAATAEYDEQMTRRAAKVTGA